MKPETEHRMIERLLDHFDSGTTDASSSELYVDIRDYTDPSRFARERQVFRGSATLVGHVSRVAKPGDYLTDVIDGVPVLVARGEDGQLRGFRNVCRHRGAVLVEDKAGSTRGFVCPYHAWTFDSSGRLTHVPDHARCFPDVLREERGLFALHVTIDNGWVFIQLTGNQRPTADALSSELSEYAFDQDRWYRSDDLEVAANWKLIVEAFLEVYHFKTLHPQMKSYIFSHEHSLVDLFDDDLRLIAPKREIRELADRPRSEWQVRPHATILYFLFPSTFLFIETRHTTTLQVRPISADHSEVRMMHVANERGQRETDRLDATIAALMQAMSEDAHICESMQKGFLGGDHEVVFGRNELGLQHFRSTLDTRLALSSTVDRQ